MKQKIYIQKLNIILKLILTLILSTLIGTALLMVVYLLPVEKINKHIVSSVYFFEREGGAFQVTNGSNGQLDGSTDALMLLEAACDQTGKNPVHAAMESNYIILENANNPAISLVEYYKGDYDESRINVASYARYWHGYLVFLKPLLFLCNYGEIRLLVASTQIILVMLFFFLASMKCKELVYPMVAFWISLNPLATMMSLQYNTIFLISVIAAIAVLLMKDKYDNSSFIWFIFFEIVGIMTSYLDFLTYPIVSLGIPLLIWYYLFHERLKTDFLKIVEFSACYGVGYIGMWSGKWIIGSFITRNNIILNALNQVKLRSSASSGDTVITFGTVLKEQMQGFIQYPVVLLLVVGIIFMVISVIRHRHRVFLLDELVIPIFIGLYPFIWFLVTKNHSYLHPYITCRELSITMFAFAIYVVSIFKVQR